MGLLGIAAFGGVLARLRAEVIGAVLIAHAAAGCRNRLLAEMHRVGAHVGDVAALIQALGCAHRFASGKAQFAVGLLLQGAGGEGRSRPAGGGFFLNVGHRPGFAIDGLQQPLGIGFAEQLDLGAGLDGTSALIEIAAGGNALTSQMAELGFKTDALMLQLGLEIPVAAAAEGTPGPLPLHQQPHRHRLHAAGREPPGHLLPEQRRNRVAHQAIENAPGFLGMHQLHVELAGLAQGALDRLFGDLVEHHALHRHLGVQQLQQVPADRFPFAVFIGCEQQLIGDFEGVLELFDDLFLVFGNHIERFEIFFSVDAGLGPFLSLVARRDLTGVVGEVAHMAHRRLHAEGAWQEAADGAGLRGALDDDEGVGHRRQQPNAGESESEG